MEQVIIDNFNYEWKFLIINDGSTDSTLDKIKAVYKENHHFHYMDLPRNYGKEIAGIDYVNGDALIIMDSDMQHPIDVMLEMIKYWVHVYRLYYLQDFDSRRTRTRIPYTDGHYSVLRRHTVDSTGYYIGEYLSHVFNEKKDPAISYVSTNKTSKIYYLTCKI